MEQQVAAAVRPCACGLLAGALESLDGQLTANRDQTRWKPVNRKARTVVTIVGEVTYGRRYYVDPRTGERRFLLDEKLGIVKRQRISPGLREQAVTLATEMSYRRAAKVLSLFGPAITAMAVWQELQRAGEAERQQAAACRERVFGCGQVPEGRRQVRELCVEADGVMIRAREAEGERKHVEIKLAVAYEGKQPTAQDRKALVERRLVGGVLEGPAFWEEAVVEWGRTWDWRSVRAVLAGDGRGGVGEERRGAVTGGGASVGWVSLAPGAAEGAWAAGGGLSSRVRGVGSPGMGAGRSGTEGGGAQQGSKGQGADSGVEEIFAAELKRDCGIGGGGGSWRDRGASVPYGGPADEAAWSEVECAGANHRVRVMVARANGKLLVGPNKPAGGSAEGRKEVWLCPSEGERLMRKQRAAGEWFETRVPALVGLHAWRAWVQGSGCGRSSGVL